MIDTMKQALAALELIQTEVEWELNSPTRKFCRKAEIALRQAIEQAKQKPVVWVGLTDEEIRLMAHNDDKGDWNDLRFRSCWHNGYVDGVNAANAKLKELNK